MNKAREIFPCGLEQPEGSFRCSQDALVLANFAADHVAEGALVADLGAGCGVVGLGILLKREGEIAGVWGVDNEEVLVEAARKNAQNLGLEKWYTGLCVDILQKTILRESWLQGNFDVVVSNPPWRLEKEGRLSETPLRRAALFGNASVLPGFVGAARFLLRERGNLFLLAGVARLADTFAALAAQRLQPVRLCFVHSLGTGEMPSAAKQASFFLVQACKGSRATLQVEPPLYLQQANSVPSEDSE